MRPKPTLEELITLARALTQPGNPHPVPHARRAFELSHRARRFLEHAADTASRDRWSMLTVPTGPRPSAAVPRFAAEVAAAAVSFPVHGEAAVYAAMLDAVDVAHTVSNRLYSHWLSVVRAHGDDLSSA